MDQKYYLLYNDFDKFAVMTLYKRDNEFYIFVYFSKNPKHLSNEELVKGFTQEVTDKSLKAKLARERFVSKFFQLPATLQPSHIGNIDFRPLKSKKDTDFGISLFHELHQNPKLQPYYSDSTKCFIKGLDHKGLDLLVDFFNKKQIQNSKQPQQGQN